MWRRFRVVLLRIIIHRVEVERAEVGHFRFGARLATPHVRLIGTAASKEFYSTLSQKTAENWAPVRNVVLARGELDRLEGPGYAARRTELRKAKEAARTRDRQAAASQDEAEGPRAGGWDIETGHEMELSLIHI